MAERQDKANRVRPRDASAILLVDRQAGPPRVLVGKRSSRHAFMPDVYVFPGGRRDAGDNRLAPALPYHPATAACLSATLAGSSAGRLNGFGICALRELAEETGLSVGGSDFRPDLSRLRYLARAVTPPGSSRRYDTQFFACYCDEIGLDPAGIRDSDELSDLRFIPLSGAPGIAMPQITRLVLGELHSFVTDEPSMGHGRPVPVYFKDRARHVRTLAAESMNA